MCTSVLHCGLTVLQTTPDRFSWPWCGSEGKMLCFPGWMESFRYGSGLKNIPFFKPTAWMSGRAADHNTKMMVGNYVDATWHRPFPPNTGADQAKPPLYHVTLMSMVLQVCCNTTDCAWGIHVVSKWPQIKIWLSCVEHMCKNNEVLSAVWNEGGCFHPKLCLGEIYGAKNTHMKTRFTTRTLHCCHRQHRTDTYWQRAVVVGKNQVRTRCVNAH